MTRLVQKFGGSALADVDAIRKAAEIAVKAAEDGYEVAVVVSSLGGTAQQLITLADRVNPNPSPREMDMLMVTGEQASAALMSMAIQALGYPARSFTGGQAGIVTENRHGGAALKEICSEEVEHAIDRGEIAVVAGSHGVGENNQVTTLGDGGVDTTAVALACAIEADRCDIFTIDDGVCTADPVVVRDARVVPALSYEEMLELAQAGSSLISAPAVELAMDNHVPLRIRSVNNYDNLGTLVTNRLMAPDNTVCSVVLDLGQSSLTLKIYSTEPEACLDGMGSLFTRLDELDIETDMVMLVNHDDEAAQELFFTTDRKHVKKVRSVITALAEPLGHPYVKVDSEVARISLVGRRLTSQPEVVAQIFETLKTANIPISLVSTSQLRVSVGLPLQQAARAVKLIHHRFQLSEGTFTAIDSE